MARSVADIYRPGDAGERAAERGGEPAYGDRVGAVVAVDVQSAGSGLHINRIIASAGVQDSCLIAGTEKESGGQNVESVAAAAAADREAGGVPVFVIDMSGRRPGRCRHYQRSPS